MNKQEALRIVLAMANDWMETVDPGYACDVVREPDAPVHHHCERTSEDIMEALEQVTQMQQAFESVS